MHLRIRVSVTSSRPRARAIEEVPFLRDMTRHRESRALGICAKVVLRYERRERESKIAPVDDDGRADGYSL